MNSSPDSRYALLSNVLFALGLMDLVRGVLHTFFAHWAVRTFAHLDLTVAGQDQLMLLGTFGSSNLLTGLIYVLISRKAKELSEYVLIMIPCAYAIGYLGMRSSGVRPQSDFLGKYFMLVYFAICLVTVILSRIRQRASQSQA